MLEKFYY